MEGRVKDSARGDLLTALRNEAVHGEREIAAPLAVMICLRWLDFQEAEAEAMAAFDETDHVPLLPPSLLWRNWCDSSAEKIHSLLEAATPIALADSYSYEPRAMSLLGRISQSILQAARLDGEILVAMVKWLSEQPFETPNDRRRLLAAFDDFLQRSERRESGQFRTPTDISELLVQLAAPAPGERLYDPCFGYAGILTTALSAVRNEAKNVVHPSLALLDIFGVERNSNAYTIGLARLVLAGVAKPQLELGNSLERESISNPAKEGFDLVISNPPWGMKIDPKALDHFAIQTNDGTSLFLQHVLSQLRPGGRAIMVVSQGFLSQSGKTAQVRKWILEHHRLDTVIGLPAGAFLPITSIEASILIVRRGGGPTERTRMVDGAQFFEPARRGQAASISATQIQSLSEVVRSSTVGRESWDIDASLFAEVDYDLSVVRREASSLDLALETLGKNVPIVPLQEVCRVSSGKTLPKEDLISSPGDENAIPYVRIGDLQRGQTTKVTSWVAGHAVEALGPRPRLRPGDILLARAGTIGKVGVVRNGAVGGVAAGSLFVLSPDIARIDPSYLTAYLSASAPLEWLQAHSSGSVISGLKKQFVELIPLPLPPLQIQERVAAAYRDHLEDAIRSLAAFLSPEDANPISHWISQSLKLLESKSSEESADPSRTVRFKIFGRSLYPATVDNKSISEVPELQAWADAMFNVDPEFRESEEVPRGPGLYGILQAGIGGLRIALETIKGNSLLESQAREMTNKCIERLEEATFSLYQPKAVEIKVVTDTLIGGQENEVSILVRNKGVLPVRSFSIRTAEGTAQRPTYLPESSEREFRLNVRTPSDRDTYTAEIYCDWVALQGMPEWSKQEVAFKVLRDSVAVEQPNLGPSPYFHGPPVGPDRDDVFFGREELITAIKSQVQSGNTVLLEGNRRSGKSSILKHLDGKDTIPGWLVVSADFQSAEGAQHAAGMTDAAIWRSLARSLATGLAPLKIPIPLPNGDVLPEGSMLGIAKACRSGISEEAPWEDFSEYFRKILGLLSDRGMGLVLMIDEFDKLQEGIDNHVTSPQIPENIRHLIQAYPHFVAVLTGSRRMQRLRHEYWSALYGLGNRIGVTALAPEFARKLVTEPVNGKLLYTEEALAMVIELTAGQPFLIQYLCNRIFELCSQRGLRSIGKSLVEEAAESFVRDNEHFASLWDYAETDRRRFLIALCNDASKGPDPVSFGLLQQRLLLAGIDISDAELDEDLKFLRELELLDFSGAGGGGIYRLTVPLMGQWLDQQQEYAALLSKALIEQGNLQ